MKKRLTVFLLLMSLMAVLAACGRENDASGKHHVEITVKDYGTISVELDGDTRRYLL